VLLELRVMLKRKKRPLNLLMQLAMPLELWEMLQEQQRLLSLELLAMPLEPQEMPQEALRVWLEMLLELQLEWLVMS
jgi:hypothetical protein